MRLLIVDDSPVMRSFVIRTLQIAGLEVESCVEASNGAEALEKLSYGGVDLILTDINMPVLDGEGLLRALQADSEMRRIPVVVVSTDSTEKRVESLLLLGARGYVKKPFGPERLSEVLSGLLPELFTEPAHVSQGPAGSNIGSVSIEGRRIRGTASDFGYSGGLGV